MPISVTATFAQEGVFFAGEKLNCTITFTNSAPPGSLTPQTNGLKPGTLPRRQSISFQPKQDPHESNGLGNSQRTFPSSQTNAGTNHERASTTSALNSPSNRSVGTSKHGTNAPSTSEGALENGVRTRLRSDMPQQRPNTTASRALSQTRVSSDISHIDAISQEHSESNRKDQYTTDQGQEDQEEQEQTVAIPSRGDANSPVLSTPGSPTPHSHQRIQEQEQQDDLHQTLSSPGLLGIASYMYRSASFSSLASAFGFSGSDSEAPQDVNEGKKLPPLPPPDLEDENERGTKETPTDSGHARTGTDGSTSGLNEGMIELQVTDNADNQSIADEGEYQTPRPSMDYSTRSSMQSVRAPFQQQYYGTPKRRSSLMSNYSAHSPSSRHLVSHVSKKEALVWASVQVIGQFMVDGSFIRQQGFEPLKTRTMYRPTGSAGGGVSGGGTLGAAVNTDWRDRANANRLFPVFSTPPSILFVDLQLAPGESTSYTYQIELPEDLPPSYRGKTIRFAYHLVIGVQRGSVHTPAKNVQLPFRLYNTISEQGVRPTYDLMSPVILHKDTAISGILGQERHSQKPSESAKLARKQFEDYVDELIKNITPNSEDVSPAQARELTRRESDAYKDEETLQIRTCLEKVSSLSRTSGAASYDICKNNIPVAKLSLIKTRFKLGETVHGIISFTTREIPTYQISVTLETMEAIEADYACRSPAQTAKLTKRVHAEMHESCIDTMRTSFALCIPPTATPEFTTTTLTLKWYIRVEFITGAASQQRFKMTSVDERRSQHQAVEALSTESFDCMVPIQVYPTSYETGALFPPTVSFSLS
ncbi:hypothetical protein BGX34_012180 [Mortierella sp. NVP85]|nr:hypothetical protein BGX34_012180 [Mortierella sp. NVP85]